MAFRWIYNQPKEENIVPMLVQELGVPETIAHLLALRGIQTFDDAKQFFRPSLDDLHDPFLMKDMDIAANRLSKAIKANEKIMIYGDYDVDGTTASAIMYIFLKDFGVDVEYYVPHRYKEGYGINTEGIDHAIEQNCTLMVSVDCGITAIDETDYATEKGLELIICDHHTVGDKIPNAVAVLNPKRPDCTYPFAGLSGAGVAYKLVQATIHHLGLPKTVANKFLDLVCISTASDIVPIIDENRIIMREGLKLLNSEPRPGLKALIDLVKIQLGQINTSSIVFSIGPRINAAGRMGDACKAIELLISTEDSEAAACAAQLESINIQRKDIDTKTMTDAIQQIDDNYNIEEDFSLVLFDENWHLGVIGIVASRLVDIYHRPAVMLTEVNGYVKGSARSVKGFNIYDAFKECDDLLEQFGGHEFAAGLTISRDNVEEFRRRINEITKTELARNDLKPELVIDYKLDLKDLDIKFWKLLSQFEPFGPHNLRPTFVSENVQIVGQPSIVGKGHLKMKVNQGDSQTFEVIGFNMHEYLPILHNCKEKKVNLAYAIENNFWNGKHTLQLRLKDIQVEAAECMEEKIEKN